MYYCIRCGEQITSRDRIEEKNKNDEIVYKCSTCGKSHTYIELLKDFIFYNKN